MRGVAGCPLLGPWVRAAASGTTPPMMNRYALRRSHPLDLSASSDEQTRRRIHATTTVVSCSYLDSKLRAVGSIGGLARMHAESAPLSKFFARVRQPVTHGARPSRAG